MKRKVSAIVWWASLVGILVASLLGYWLRERFDWLPNVEAQVVRSLLVGMIQTHVGIWAIAVSFSLLYVQISADVYSPGVARLLVRHRAFRRMTRDYVLILVLDSMMALFVTPKPEFLPLLAGTIGVTAFIYGLAVMVTYIGEVVHYITPDTIIGELRGQISYERIQEEALEKTLSRQGPSGWESQWEGPTIRMPTKVAAQSRVGDEVRILIDIAKRMVRRSDHVAVKAAIDGIVGLKYGNKRLPRPSRLGPNATREEIAAEIEEKELTMGAVLAYLAGALMEVWTTAIQSRDRQTAGMLISAMGKILPSDILYNFVARTNVLQVAIYDQMFQDTGRLDWLDLRLRVIRLLTARLGSISHDNPMKNPNAWSVYSLLERMGRDLLGEERYDFSGELEIFKGFSILGQYGAAVGDDAIVGEVLRYLPDRAQRGCSETWRRQTYMAEGPMAELVQKMGSRWIRGTRLRKDHVSGKPFLFLLDQGTEQVVVAYNQAIDAASEPYPSHANFRYLDALEEIAIACIEAEQWHWFDATLRRMNRLVMDPKLTPDYAAACFAEVLEAAVKMAEPRAIEVWVGAMSQFLDRNSDVKSEYGFARVLSQARKAQDSGVVAPGSELEARLTSLIERLAKTQAEREGGK